MSAPGRTRPVDDPRPADPRPADPRPAPAGPARPGPTRWQRQRVVVLGAALVVLLGLVTALLTPRTSREALAPDSTAPDGARAVARVLAQQGVDVVPTTTFEATAGALRTSPEDTTVLVTGPDLLSQRRWDALTASGADLVLLAPGADALDLVAPGVVTSGTVPADVVDPGCAAAVPRAAGAARAGGRLYAPTTGTEAVTCYAGSWLRLPAGEGRPGTLTLLGQEDVVTNRYAAADGDAALALGTLGARPRLVWYVPSPLDTDDATVPLSSLVPPWALPGAALLLLAGLVAALWRARRLGRLVPEPLPVVVRAVETVEGHGRLYATAGATGRAAQALRAATLRRVRVLVRLGPAAGVDDVAEQVARATGRPAADVRALLAEDAPRDDAALVRLARALTDLERDVRHHGP